MANPKILIVDDEPFNVDYLEQELEDLNYLTISAANGQEALEKVASESPDLVLLDIMMPVMDGFEVLSRLKDNPATRDIPVIVISAQHDLRSVVQGIQLGAEDYLPKPFEPILLRARLSSSLEKKQLRDLQQLYLRSLEREFDIARGIQRSFLPSELPQVAGWEIATYFKAAREVAGDFYDAFLLPDGNLIGVIGDVCGKGVGAALFMTLFRSLIRVTSTSDIACSGKDLTSLDPSERLRRVISFTNKYLVETHGSANMFATIFIGLFNLQTGLLTFMNCGNESPLLLRQGCVINALQPTGPVVGIIPGVEFSIGETHLEHGDLLLAFTDGLPDARNAAKDFFGVEHLLQLIRGDEASPAVLLKQIEEHLHQFIGAADQFDDITLLAVRRCA